MDNFTAFGRDIISQLTLKSLDFNVELDSSIRRKLVRDARRLILRAQHPGAGPIPLSYVMGVISKDLADAIQALQVDSKTGGPK